MLSVVLPIRVCTTVTWFASLQAAAQLADLVCSHDVVFLLTDTRESRWLPTLLCAASCKVAITAALGFDSYVVMRHGIQQQQQQQPPKSSGTQSHGQDNLAVTAATAASQSTDIAMSGSGKQSAVDQSAVQQEATISTAEAASAAPGSPAAGLHGANQRRGCYFCNDVVAPLNSTVDRTLDQQCTVARPGLAAIAGALAVELTAALLQHPLGVHAPAPAGTSSSSSGGSGGALGPVPHMIRGQLSGFSQVCAAVYCWKQH